MRGYLIGGFGLAAFVLWTIATYENPELYHVGYVPYGVEPWPNPAPAWLALACCVVVMALVFIRPARVKCAWCGRRISRLSERAEHTSHGICGKCSDKFDQDSAGCYSEPSITRSRR